MLGCADVAAIFADDGTLQAMLDFEAALAAAEAGLGVIPPVAAAVIAAECRVDRLELAGFADDAARAGNLAIPLVKRLTARVAAQDREFVQYRGGRRFHRRLARISQRGKVTGLLAADMRPGRAPTRAADEPVLLGRGAADPPAAALRRHWRGLRR